MGLSYDRHNTLQQLFGGFLVVRLMKWLGIFGLGTAVLGAVSPALALECSWSTEVYTYVCVNTGTEIAALDTNTNTYTPTDGPVDNSNFVEPDNGEDSIFGHTYYGRFADFANVYSEPSRASTLVRNVGDGYLYATVNSWAKDAAGENWYEVNLNEYVHESEFKMVNPSPYRGVEVLEQPQRPFGWIVTEVIPSTAPDVEPPLEEEGGIPLPRATFIQVYDAVLGEEDWLWYNIGEGRWVKQTFMSLVDADPRPAEVGDDEYWTEVDLFEQTFAAYEGDKMVYAALISSGLNRWPTREGIFQVWDRWEKHKMSGAEGRVEYYFHADIPDIMYFDHYNGIALHGTYWHDRFGFKHSHGCVNMSIQDAEWTFRWSEQGPNDLWVYVHTQDPMAHLAEFGH
jgi:hypothetical protein